MKQVFSSLLLWFLIFLAVPSWAEEAPLKIGVLAFRPKVQAMEQWQPLSSYLKTALGRDIELSTYSYSELDRAILNNELDVVLTNPAHYILLRHRNSLSAPLVTQITKKGEYELTAFGGVIFTRADSTISTLSEINKHKVAATKIESLGGYKMQAYELFSAGLDLPKDKRLLLTGMPHDNVVNVVLSEQADIGFVRTGVLESLQEEGKLDLSKIKILNRQNVSTFPFMASTRLYPEWPLAIMSNIDDHLARQITIALLSLKPEHPAAIAAKIHGFTTPANYAGVESLLRDLRVEPFNIAPHITLLDLWEQNTKGIVIVTGLTLLLLILGLRLVVQNRFIKKSENRLISIQDNLNSTLSAIPDSMFELGLDGTYYSVRTPNSQLLVEEKNALLGKRVSDVMDKEAADICLASLQEANTNQFSSGHQIKLTLSNEEKWFELSVERKTISHEGQPIFVVLSRDITARIKSEEQLRLVSRVFSDTHESVSITNRHGLIIDVNPAYCKATGYSREEIIGKNPSILNSGKQSPEFYKTMWQHINEYGYWQGEVWNRTKGGEIYAGLLSISSLTNEQGVVTHYIGVSTDITQSKKQQEKLNLMAHYDVLTGLPNRALFVDRFHQAIAHSNRTQTQLAVCFLDLDQFKPVNDNYGHDVGDQLLIEVAQRIKACIREEDTVSRQGGDEFALLLNNIESLVQVEQTLERLHESLAQPYGIDDHVHNITLSSGATLYPADNGDIDTLLRHADNAMYQAKQAGRNRYQLFSIEQDQRIIQKHHRLEEIEQALYNDELELYYQPKVNMVTGEVFGAEALIRWIHPEKGLIAPLAFLPIIEGTALEIKVGDWVIEQALKQLEFWHQHGIQPEVSVNIASHHLHSEDFVSTLDATLARYPRVDSQCLQLEILESSALGDLNAISQIIKSCQHALGVKVALDDFGTGYSSLTHLRSLPANTIKIDQSFVRDMLDDPSDYAIIDGVIGLAGAFNREVIAEGVETSEHGVMLMIMGCYQAQGYGIAKPMPAGDFINWLSNYQPNEEWLDNGHQQRTDKENKVKLFRIVTNHWLQFFMANILSSPEDIHHWPIMGNRQDHCAHWIKRAQQEKLFKESGIALLDQAHEEVHAIANMMQHNYETGDIEAARAVLLDLQAAFDKMSNVLGRCE